MKNDHTFVVLAYKRSPFLEDCIKSVVNQSFKTNIVIATSTPNPFINELAKKYELEVLINKNRKMGIGYDFDFAINCAQSELVTIAHQDDVYDYNYVENVINEYQKHSNATIIFSDYYEIKKDLIVEKNRNLKIKRILLLPLKLKKISDRTIIKRLSLSFGCSICCPSVTFVKSNIPKFVFSSHFKCDVDWYAWERLSKIKGEFIYISQKLIGHRIHGASTTTATIHKNIRTKEDLEMFKKFWPNSIAKIINKYYIKSEENNDI